MDSATVIVSALAAGAAACRSPTIEDAVREAYSRTKDVIELKYPGGKIGLLEQRPEWQSKRDAFADHLRRTGADADDELIRLATALLDALTQYSPATGPAIGVDLEDVTAANLRIHRVASAEIGIRIRQSRFSGDIQLANVLVGREGHSLNP